MAENNRPPMTQGIAEANAKLSPAQLLWVATLLDPTMATGAADMFAGLPPFPSKDMTVEDMFAGPRDPSFLENIQQGNYGTAVLQTAGIIPGLGALTRIERIAELHRILRQSRTTIAKENAAINVGEGAPAYRARQKAMDMENEALRELKRANLEKVDDVREAVPEGGIETLLNKKPVQDEFDF